MNKLVVMSKLARMFPNVGSVEQLPSGEIVAVLDDGAFLPELVGAVGRTVPRAHLKADVTYEVVEGVVMLVVQGTLNVLHEGDKLDVCKRNVHHLIGDGAEGYAIVRISYGAEWTPSDTYLV